MKSRVSVITLAVDNLVRAVAFYRDGLGLAFSEAASSDDHAVFELQEGLNLVLCPRDELVRLVSESRSAPPTERAADLFDRRATNTILSYVAETREEVTGILRDAEAAGGRVPREPVDRFWGYTGYFLDPEGNAWEVVWYSEAPAPAESNGDSRTKK